MPRIVPIELLKCLKVLLDENGGILSAGEVKRIASLMTKYSKKLVSKCIYVQILKCTKTELLGEFMGAGGWSLVYTWLHDAIRAMNWPLVQEILELLLLCPVDMYRLRINSAPKLVKGLCKDGGNEGVRILAKRLVEQWLKIVTENPEGGPAPTAQAQQQQQQQQTFSPASSTATTPIPTCLVKTTEVLAMAPAHLTNAQESAVISSPSTSSTSSSSLTAAAQKCVKKDNSIASEEEENIMGKEEKSEDDDNEEDSEEDEINNEENATEKDPLAEVQTDNATGSSTYALTPAQKKANESGLVYKIVVKDGQQVLAKVAKPLASAQQQQQLNNYGQEITEAEKIMDEDDNAPQDEKRTKVEQQQQKQKPAISSKVKSILEQEETTSSSIDKIDKESENSNSSSNSNNSNSSSSGGGSEGETDSKKLSHKATTVTGDKDKKKSKRLKEEKKLMEKPKEIVQQHQQHSPSLSLSPNRLERERENKKNLKETKERRSSSSNNAGGAAADKEKERDGKKSSSSHKSSSSSSSHKSSSSKSSSTTTSTSNKTKSSSSSSSSAYRSSSDKHKDKEPRSSSISATSSTSNKDKERSSSSSSNSSSSKHKSPSSSSTSSSSTKDKYRDKEREKSNGGHKNKERTEKENTITTTTTTASQLFQNSNEKDLKTSGSSNSSSTTTSPSIDKLGRIPKKSQQNKESESLATTVNNKPISINIPSKKSSISIEIRKDTDRAKTVKTYKSQFRSHGLTEEAPPPPSRKGLKKPSSSSHSTSGVILPTSLPSSSMKRSSPPPPRDSPTIEKKAKIDLNNVAYAVNDKPGAIKLIPPKKIQTLVETNLFSDALSAATGPKKLVKRKKPTTTTSLASTANSLGSTSKEEPSPPISPDLTKVVRLKFYQDTLDDTKTDDNKSDKEGGGGSGGDDSSKDNLDDSTSPSLDKLEKDIEDDDDIPLKKVKEDIEQKVAKEKNQDLLGKLKAAELANESTKENKLQHTKMAEDDTTSVTNTEEVMVKKPGPGCGPNGPPGVLVIHRRKGPKKKLKWCPPEALEQIRYFELDETERVNVTKTSFMDMKNLERFNERDAIIMSRRGFHREDNMEVQTTWRPLIEVDDVPPHPDGSQSKQRKIQAEREMTTLRALYFSQAIIPDSPAEAEIEPVFTHDIPVIPLDDITRNPDAVNDFTSMPWPESKGSPKQGDSSLEGTGGLGSPMDMFLTPIVNSPAPVPTPAPTPSLPVAVDSTIKATPVNPFNPFVPPFANTVNAPNQHVTVSNSGPPNPWQSSNMNNNNNNNNNNMAGISLPFGPPSNIDMPITANMVSGPMGNNNNNNNGPQQNFMHQFGPGPHPFGMPTNQFGPSNVMFNGPGHNFGPLGANNIMMGVGPMGIPPLLMNQRSGNNRNSGGGNWRTGSNNYADNWRSGPPNRGGSGNSSGVCKAYIRGHCRLGKSCKYIHPRSKRI